MSPFPWRLSSVLAMTGSLEWRFSEIACKSGVADVSRRCIRGAIDFNLQTLRSVLSDEFACLIIEIQQVS